MKKYLLFIVEGNNDKREIQAIIRAACGEQFTNNFVDAYHVHNGDITTEKNTDEKTIIKKLNDIVISWRIGKESPYIKLRPSDVARIIHVVDTDGVFIPEDSIIEADDGRASYHDDYIQCPFPHEIIGRNRKKERVINKLLQIKQIDNIPYMIYFASCNMDHVLFNERNPNRKDKNQYSFDFGLKCTSRDSLMTSVLSPNIGLSYTYKESWDYIKEEYNSLCRLTNMNLFLQDIIDS